MNITIKELCPELIEDYLGFFDRAPHSERPESDDCKCYCVWWCADNHTEECFAARLSAKEKRREYARESILAGRLRGYLAYCEGKPVGWCNANEKAACYDCFCWKSFMGAVKREEKGAEERVKAVFCFAVAPEMRGKGVARLLLRRVCEAAAAEGFSHIEGYPNREYQSAALDFMGPYGLYESEGFVKCYEAGDKAVMRKRLK